MMRRFLIATLGWWIIAACHAAAPDAAQRASVTAILKDMEQATNARDVGALLKHAAEEIVMVSKNGEIVAGKQAAANYLNKMIGAAPSLKELKTTLRDPRITVAATDTLIVDGRSDDYYAFTSGMDFSITTTWSATLVRQAGAWRIATLHFSFNLFDNPLLRAAQKWAYIAGGVALLLGALLGALAMYTKKSFKNN